MYETNFPNHITDLTFIFNGIIHLCCRPMTAPQLSRCDQGHKGGTAANHAMSGGVNTRWVRGCGQPNVQTWVKVYLPIAIKDF